jgi:hypothetical protein
MARFNFHVRGPIHFAEDDDEVFGNKLLAVAYAGGVARELRAEAAPDYYYCS